MRQNFKKEQYFEEIIQKEIENITDYEQKYLKKKRERGESYKGNAFSIIISSGLDIVIESKYSKGDSISSLIDLNSKKVEYFINTFKDIDYSDGGGKPYSKIINTISLSLLFSNKKSLFLLLELFNKIDYPDYLVSFLLKDYGAKQHKELLFPKYKSLQILKQVVQSNKNDAEVLLKEYLEKHYYTKENLEEVYNSHKTEKGYIFSGYWSWEAAAIVKVMGLDDSSFKDNPYYPYDMVHWQD